MISPRLYSLLMVNRRSANNAQELQDKPMGFVAKGSRVKKNGSVTQSKSGSKAVLEW